MKKIFSKKAISIFVMIAFVSVFCLPVHSGQVTIDQTGKQGKVNKTTEKAAEQEKGKVESEAEVEIDEYYSRDDANVIEDEGYPGGKKKKKFPWLLVVGGIVVVGVVLYFLVFKKAKYDLTVTVGEGVTGNPATGTYTHKEKETVNYSYSLQAGYTDLVVKVDGAAVAASGTVTMDANKSLTATATKVAALIVNSNPTGAQIILDGNDSGETTNHTFMFTTGGSHTLALRKVGYIQANAIKSVALGDTETVNKTLTRGLREYFSTGAMDSILWKWVEHPSGNWSLSDGKYVADATLSDSNYSIYNLNWGSDNYTVTVRMARMAGSTGAANQVILATGTNANSLNGYRFNYTATGKIGVYRVINYNIDGSGGSVAWKTSGWESKSAINTGLGSYNTLKIVRNGSTYSFYINNTLVNSFSDSVYSPRYIIIGGYNGNMWTTLNFDYVYVDIGSTAGSVPGPSVSIPQSAIKDNPEYHKR